MVSTTLAHLAVTQLKGVGAQVAERLAKLGIVSVQDLLFHLPLRYEDRTRLWNIADLLPGSSASIQGEIVGSEVKYGRRRMLLVRVFDGTGTATLRFFTFSAAQKESLSKGKQIRCYGEVKRGVQGPELIHPEYRTRGITDAPMEVAETLTPVYPTTDGLKQATWRKLTDQALAMLNRHRPEELLPAAIGLGVDMSLTEALRLLHRPPPDVSQQQLIDGEHPAQQRLIIEELVAHHLSVLQFRQQSNQLHAPALHTENPLQQRFLANLPFTPTGAQQRVVNEIKLDLARHCPMMRLVQGDVGAGKTLVAALAALTALAEGYQVALMAPTELLAEQHAHTFSQWLTPLGIELVWLAGKTKGKARKAALEKLADGSGQLAIGTHALFQDDVQFAKLALVIIDEQHRFGVHQRLTLREKGAHDGLHPHQLIMTATPIPRTLAMTAYADLDTSIIDELPPGRTPIKTVAIPDTRRDEVVERIRAACVEQQRQAYWVCTLIEESEVLQCQAAEDAADDLRERLPELRIGLVHGRLKADEKQQRMAEFKQGEIDVLVATTVIEVGVDVPNASLMVIENPERLGLAQLHQLRGRVGRGSVASHCVLLYSTPLSKTANKRLAVLRESNDGFVIAQRDLEIRGPGELLGTRQTGLAAMKIADLSRDQQWVPVAQRLGQQIAHQYPDHMAPLIQRWLGERQEYGHA